MVKNDCELRASLIPTVAPRGFSAVSSVQDGIYALGKAHIYALQDGNYIIIPIATLPPAVGLPVLIRAAMGAILTFH